MIKNEFEINENLERIIMRREVDAQDKHTQARIRDYLRQKRAWVNEQRAGAERLAYGALASLNPVVRELRHTKLEAARFPEGTRIRELFDLVESLRGPFAAIEREHNELTAQLRAAQTALNAYDVERAASPHEFNQLTTTLDFYTRKRSSHSPKMFEARAQYETAQSSFRHAYAEYSRLVDELNAIGPLDRPLAEGERIEDRARDAGEIARLEFLIAAILKPGERILQSSAARGTVAA
jgi:chromosome segregation ATPase